ncbi:MAG: hypothetical protein ABI239_14435 [Aquihabitans sp.]
MSTWRTGPGRSSSAFGKRMLNLDEGAPGEISDDMQVFASALREMASVDFEDEEAMSAVQEKYSDDESVAVNDRIEAFRADNCGSAPD